MNPVVRCDVQDWPGKAAQILERSDTLLLFNYHRDYDPQLTPLAKKFRVQIRRQGALVLLRRKPNRLDKTANRLTS